LQSLKIAVDSECEEPEVVEGSRVGDPQDRALAREPRASVTLPRWRPPVSWLLGAQLIGSLKKILLFTMYGGRLDVRDWMRADVVDRSRHPDGRAFADGECYWFDYISDCGDGEEAMYSLAWALQRGTVSIDGDELPRGDFLIVGGDTAYHVADWQTLNEQFCKPFALARKHLQAAGQARDPRRPLLLAIPGNHDYYDMLDGFNRQFRAVVDHDVVKRVMDVKRTVSRCLEPEGYQRVQDASYVAVKLPHDWWFWGVDTAEGHVDIRQRCFFLAAGDGREPDKLIVATPTPPVVHGRCVARETRLMHNFASLGLEPCFADHQRLAAHKCRLDLSGDVHHYARYGGTSVTGAADEPVTNYASVVSGLGGAFHHPTCTVHGGRTPERLYPEPSVSFRTVARRLLAPHALLSSGMLWMAGSLLSILIFLGVASDGNIGRLAAAALTRLGVDVMYPVAQTSWQRPTLASIGLAATCLTALALLWVASRWTKLVFLWSRTTGPLSGLARWFDHPRWIRRYWPAVAATITAAALPWIASVLLPLGSASDVAVETSFVFLLGIVTFGLVGMAVQLGAASHGIGGKVGFALLGLFHAALQLATPTLIALLTLTSVWLLPTVLATLAAATLVARRATTAPHPVWNLVLWLLGGAACLAVPMILAGERPLPLRPSELAVGLPLVAILGACLSATWLGWYLVVALGFSGHNNEAAAAARVDVFRQFIRFCVEPDRVTGHVIGVGRPEVVDGQVVVPSWLIDRFAVGPAPRRSAAEESRT